MPDTRIRMLGIDPGLATTGYAVLDKYDELNNLDLIKSGTIRTNSKSTKSTRLGLIFAELMELIELFQPDEIAVETQFIAKNVKAAMSVSEVRATALIAASRYGIPVLSLIHI